MAPADRNLESQQVGAARPGTRMDAERCSRLQTCWPQLPDHGLQTDTPWAECSPFTQPRFEKWGISCKCLDVWLLFKKSVWEPGRVLYAYNLATGETEVGRSQVQTSLSNLEPAQNKNYQDCLASMDIKPITKTRGRKCQPAG